MVKMKKRSLLKPGLFSAAIPAHIHHVQQNHRLSARAPGRGSTFQEVEMVEGQSAHMLAASQSFTEPGDGRSSPSDSGRDPASPFEHDRSDPEAFNVAETVKSVTDRPGPAIQPVYAENYLEARHIGDALGLSTLPHSTYGHTDSSHGKLQMEQTTNTAIFSELSDLSTWHSLVNMSNDSARFDASSYAKISLPFVDEPQADSSCTDGSSMSSTCPEDFDVPQGMRQRDDLSIFMPACMLACMYEAARRNDIKALCLEQAKSAFRRLCIVGSPFVLTSAITMLTWMLVHVQSSFTDDVMWSAHCVASDVLGSDDSISVLLRWMFLAAATKLAQSPIDSSELRRIRLALQKVYGDNHRHSIVATYCLAFHLMIIDRLDNANALIEAVGLLCHIETIARSVLGASDLMTINIVSTLSRAYSRMEDFPTALAAINRSLQAEPLGANHPHRLEIIVRKAILCRKMGWLEQTEELYWVVLRGRIATLGQEHRSTNKAHHSLVVVLKERGQWDRMKDAVHRLVVDPQVAVTEYESWWRRVVEANNSSTRLRASNEDSE